MDRADWVGGVVDAQYVNQLCDPLEIFDRWQSQYWAIVPKAAQMAPLSRPEMLIDITSSVAWIPTTGLASPSNQWVFLSPSINVFQIDHLSANDHCERMLSEFMATISKVHRRAQENKRYRQQCEMPMIPHYPD